MKYDAKNALKLQLGTYLEESLSMVGKMMINDLFDTIDRMSEKEATEFVDAHYDENIFDLIAPYLDLAAEEYDVFKSTPEGQKALEELKQVTEQAKELARTFETIKNLPSGNDGEGNGNVH